MGSLIAAMRREDERGLNMHNGQRDRPKMPPSFQKTRSKGGGRGFCDERNDDVMFRKLLDVCLCTKWSLLYSGSLVACIEDIAVA